VKDLLWCGKWFSIEVLERWKPLIERTTSSVATIPGAFVTSLVDALFLVPRISGPYLACHPLPAIADYGLNEGNRPAPPLQPDLHHPVSSDHPWCTLRLHDDGTRAETMVLGTPGHAPLHLAGLVTAAPQRRDDPCCSAGIPLDELTAVQAKNWTCHRV